MENGYLDVKDLIYEKTKGDATKPGLMLGMLR